MQLVEAITRCEGCGEEIPELIAEIKRYQVMNGGRKPRLMLPPLRAPFWCASCNAKANRMLGSFTELEDSLPARERAGEAG
ncbi:MAG TPA: hypothetical protein VMU89_14830 [Thermomicrobiaceae bacterium]|nr:hypothetical protein [Thermomicrobiaceae bacterium]